MPATLTDATINVFSTAPQSGAVDKAAYLQNVADVARWSEQSECKGILIYTDNSLIDPWLVAQIIIEHTKALCPLVAIQPVYMHPYSVAKMVTSYAYLYGRQIYLNMVAGGFTNDLVALNDTTPHDKRYERLIEYTTIIKELLAGTSPVSYKGEFYTVDKLKLAPPLPEELFPGIFISGSSEAGLAAARALGATAVHYPKPVGDYAGMPTDSPVPPGIRIGVIARDHEHTAWEIAYARFPADRKGQLTHQLAMKTSDSVWHRQLSQLAEEAAAGNNPYWLHPFQNYKTFCPYLVGDYGRVAGEIAKYIAAGFRTFILDIPPSEEELHHIGVVFRQATSEVAL